MRRATGCIRTSYAAITAAKHVWALNTTYIPMVQGCNLIYG